MRTILNSENLGNIFSKLAKGENLTWQETQTAADRVFMALSEAEEQDSFGLATAFFGALTIKKPCAEELVGISKAMEQTKTVDFRFNIDKPVVTAGGTGGDTIHTINITTPAIITAAAAGAYAVKSGSKSFSSKTGCIDVVETLGINTHLSPREVKEAVERLGTVIWSSADIYPWMPSLIKLGSKPAMRQVLPLLYSLRLAIATSLNPFSLKRQIRGVSQPFTELVANVLSTCRYERAFVVLGYGKTDDIRIDEFSTLGINIVSELKTNGAVETFNVYPEDIGIKRGAVREILARESHCENAEVVKRVLAGKDKSSCRDIVLLNAAAILVLSEECKDLTDGYELAKQSVDDGRAFAKLEELVQFKR